MGSFYAMNFEFLIEFVHFLGQSIFFTGSAGTGKSFLLKRLISHLPPETTVVTASTGMAACQISGGTLHSFAGIGTGEDSFEACAQRVLRLELLQKIVIVERSIFANFYYVTV